MYQIFSLHAVVIAKLGKAMAIRCALIWANEEDMEDVVITSYYLPVIQRIWPLDPRYYIFGHWF
jgi:hypothetical protein